MPLEMQGFDDLENDLTNMAAALEFGPGVDRALQAGAKPIEEQMLHNASTDPRSSPARSTIPSIPARSSAVNVPWARHITIGVHQPRRAGVTRTTIPPMWSMATAVRPLRPRIPIVRPAYRHPFAEDAYDDDPRAACRRLAKMNPHN